MREPEPHDTNPSTTKSVAAMSPRTLVPFFAVSFGLTWGIAALWVLFPDALASLFGDIGYTNPLFILAVYAPAIAAFALVLRHGGLGGLARFLGRLLLWRCHGGWYAFVILGIPALMYAAAAIQGALGDVSMPFDPWYAALPALAIALLVGPIEEFGWRGLALPLLQRRYAPFQAGLLLGIVWAVWHIPAFLVGGTPQDGWSFVPYFIAVVAASIIITALFNDARGSLLLAALVHFQLNNPLWPDAQPYDALTFTLAAVAVVWIRRDAMFTLDHAATQVVPADYPPRCEPGKP